MVGLEIVRVENATWRLYFLFPGQSRAAPPTPVEKIVYGPVLPTVPIKRPFYQCAHGLGKRERALGHWPGLLGHGYRRVEQQVEPELDGIAAQRLHIVGLREIRRVRVHFP